METIAVDLIFLGFVIVLVILLLIYIHKTRKQMKELEAARIQAKNAMVEARKAGDEATRARQEAEAARAEAEAANRAKTDFLSNMSHNIRTPLNAIIGMTAIAGSHVEDSVKVADCLKKIESSGTHLLGVVNDVLDMSKIESGKFTLNVRPVSLRETLDVVRDIIHVELEAKSQKLEIRMEGLISEDVYCDGGRLNQVLINLLSNAVKYTPKGGTIVLSLAQKLSHRGKGYVQNHFSVRDNGIGMSEEFQKKLFPAEEHSAEEHAEEEHAVHVYEVHESGLGLTIIKHILDAMEGTIDVESAPGKGTAFYVTVDFEMVQEEQDRLLAESRFGEEADDPVQSDVWLEGMSILLAEDNEINAELACTILEDKGAFVEVAENGEIAYEKFAASSEGYYDLILMDLRMPVMNGLETTKAIRAMDRGDAITVLIVAMTADAFSEDIQNCLEAGMNGHISKPIDVPKLTKTLTKYLRFLG